jgi:transcriptional pleiotropic regulator of transition state genes
MKESNIKGKHGICRTVDELGRVGLPKEIREHMGLLPRDKVEMIVEEDCVILKKHAEGCVFCRRSEEDLIPFRQVFVCRDCLRELASATSDPVEL